MPAQILTDEMFGHIQETMDAPRDEVASELGISKDLVTRARKMVREGTFLAGTRAPWSEEEDDIIRSFPNYTAKQLVQFLPGRAWMSIKARRSKLGAAGAGGGYIANPNAPAGRKVLARTCRKCGRLLAGDWFAWRASSKTWRSECKSCASERGGKWKRDNGYSSQPANEHRQRISLRYAERKGQEYTERDMRILSDATLTTLQKAILLKRTYYGTSCAVDRFGFDSAPALGDPERDVWVIHNPNIS